VVIQCSIMGNLGSLVYYCYDDEYEPDPNKALRRRKYQILGRGNNRDGHLSSDDDRFAIDSWQRLSEFEEAMKGGSGVLSDHLYINYESTILLNNASDIYAVGNNKHFKLGINDSADSTIFHFQQIPFDKQKHGNPLVLSQGIHSTECSFIFTEKRKLFVSGNNTTGLFGNGTTNGSPSVLTEVDCYGWLGTESIAEIHCGESHSLFLTESNKLFGCGSSISLGTDDNEYSEDVLIPVLVQEGITSVATGMYHSLLLNESNKLIILGTDQSETELTESTAKKTIQNFFNGKENNHLEPLNVYSGFQHGMVLCHNKDTGKKELYTFGNNEYGQIGNNTVQPNPEDLWINPWNVTFKDYPGDYVIEASSGKDHNVVLTNTNRVFAFGNNADNKCGNKKWPPVEKQSTPFLIDKADKKNGLGLTDGMRVEMVIATNCATLIVVG